MLFVISLYLLISREIHLLWSHFPNGPSKTCSTCQCSQGKQGRRLPGHPSPLQIEDLFKETLKRSNTISPYCVITSPAKPFLCYFDSHRLPALHPHGNSISAQSCTYFSSPCCSSAVYFSFHCCISYWHQWCKSVNGFEAGPFCILMVMGTFLFKRKNIVPNLVHCWDFS